MRKRRVATLAAAGLVLLAGAGAAFAYFTDSASDTSAASIGSQSVSIAATAGTPGTPLYPGGTGDVTLQVTNPNDYPVTLVSVVAAGGAITATGGVGTCTTTGVSFQSQTGLSQPIPANSTTQVDLPGAASMSTASPTGCQGATFSIPVTITVES